jgi:hypothetical protein
MRVSALGTKQTNDRAAKTPVLQLTPSPPSGVSGYVKERVGQKGLNVSDVNDGPPSGLAHCIDQENRPIGQSDGLTRHSFAL